jgi:hypothetical protein
MMAEGAGEASAVAARVDVRRKIGLVYILGSYLGLCVGDRLRVV